MRLYISIIGIDGSGKSTVIPPLTNLITAELGLTTIAVGDDCWGKTPQEDLFRPGFTPDGELFSTRLGRLFRRAAKANTAHRRLYPLLKLAQLALQERTVRGLGANYQPDIILSDGNLLLSAAGRAINYVDAKAISVARVIPRNSLPYIEALYNYVFMNRFLPQKVVQAIPGLKVMRWLRWFDQQFKLDLLRLPDAVIFLDVAPATALARLRAGGETLDHHENLRDLAQAQAMYRGVVEFFRRRQGDKNVAVIDVTTRSIGQTLEQMVEFVRELTPPKKKRERSRGLLGTSNGEISKTSAILKKALSYQYLVRYTLPNLHRGSAYELTFPLSKLGRTFLKEGYSARMMRAIYLQKKQRHGLLDRIFLDYPIHQAVYHRLQVLNQVVEIELRQRLEKRSMGEIIKVMTAPSGYAFDLFQPLQRLSQSDWAGLKPMYILASDFDPNGDIEDELERAAEAVDVGLGFVRGDLTSAEMEKIFKRLGPYDMIFFVGFSCWLPKTHLVSHLKLIRHLLAPDGVFFTDCFTPQAFALSGKYVGYKANYYTPREFTHILVYCGFNPANVTWTSEPTGINHVCVSRDTAPSWAVRPRYIQETARPILPVPQPV
jgi:thymidylate kinase